MSINLSEMTTLNNHSADYFCIISGITKFEAINLMKNINMTEETGTL